MWLLPSRSRPHNAERLFKAWGATTPGSLRVDDCDPLAEAYRALALPQGWKLTVGPRRPLGELYNEFYAYHPNLDWYGFIADDVVPETEGWDRKLIEIAGQDGMAVPSGGESTGGSPHFVLAGSLVREQGWLCLPGLHRIYIDTVWQQIAKANGVYRYAPEIRLEHHHFSNRRALFDGTYRKSDKSQDRALYEAWLQSRKETLWP